MTNTQNEDLQVDLVNDYLKGKKIALCVTGGIASIETPKIARHLRRFGAKVRAYMTDESQKFIGKSALEWATEQNVVTTLSGMAEHICMEDLVLVAPATLNTINKFHSGLADNAVMTLLESALGYGKPILIAPTMHGSLVKNPIFLKNIGELISYGVKIIPPRLSEGKAKMPSIDSIVARVTRELSDDKIKDKKILVTAGPTPVYLDDVRMIANIFSGALGVKIATELYLKGADVKLLLGRSAQHAPSYIDTTVFRSYDEYSNLVFSELSRGHGSKEKNIEKHFPYDVAIFSAAVADYMPKEKYNGKIPSGGQLTLEMVPTAKIIDAVREKYPELYMTTFKFTIGKSKDELLQIAKNRSEKYQLVVANRGEEMQNEHKAYIVNKNGVISEPNGKDEIARRLIEIMRNGLKYD